MLEVVVQQGRHSVGPPDGFEAFITELLTALGYAGKWKIILGARIKGTPHTKGITTLNVEGPSIVARIQPGDNATRCVCRILPPNSIDPEEVCKRINNHLAEQLEKKNQQPKTTIAVPNTKMVEKISLPAGNSQLMEPKIFLKDPGNLGLALLAFVEACESKTKMYLSRDSWITVMKKDLFLDGSPQSLAKVTQALLKKQWIAKEPQQQEGYYHGYTVTEAGRKQLGSDQKSVQDVAAYPLETQLQELLAKVAEHLDDVSRREAIITRLEQINQEQSNLQQELKHLDEEMKISGYQEAKRKLVQIQAILDNNS